MDIRMGAISNSPALPAFSEDMLKIEISGLELGGIWTTLGRSLKKPTDGICTMGVLTKPDLATERTTQDTVSDLVQGRRSKLKLEYYVAQNRSADDNISTASDRLAAL
ncbi:unnamed protein product [Clonostachys rhizophaga]|uniref:Uncharacterized protein n=1 Tax=Clonostachys rhizophaga TaxID=160324 RepID=A0A9N9VUH7_9HYPO|nr:unnamed protein product [Clonostachys rhizophaga]